jgi:hypothetical protein
LSNTHEVVLLKSEIFGIFGTTKELSSIWRYTVFGVATSSLFFGGKNRFKVRTIINENRRILRNRSAIINEINEKFERE